ncbi:MAG TPA: ADP-ribosylglycohydrolase family protein [Polyangiaceae bacterium]|nr:ADP-ribosylglycohydrolase family protein [Polyangiaceae bacterium]
MSWQTPLALLREELTQRRDEGVVVPDALASEIAALDPRAPYDARIETLYDAVMALPEDAALAAAEPNELEAIRALRPAGPRDLGWAPADTEALERFHGAWTGRAVGCALGKPVEGMGMSTDADGRVVGRLRIRDYLERRGDWPLRDYFSGRDAGDGARLWCPASQREHIAFMEPDDDIHYTLVALGVLEESGPDFDWQTVARYWLAHIPIYSICTAEAQAIQTFQNRSTRPGCFTCAATPAETRRHRNPYREWIGAQIRSDGWAWVAAGKPELASELAWRDASWTHERNGIYGEMMFAAIQAAAFVEHDPRRLVEIGLSEIPAASRLARGVRDVLGWVKSEPTFEACAARIENAYLGMSPVHTINNALLSVAALFYGEMDTARAITTAVMMGHDTDCNGATVGSIVGAARGRTRFGEELAGRLHDTIKPRVAGFETVTMRELAVRTLAQFRRVEAYARARG